MTQTIETTTTEVAKGMGTVKPTELADALTAVLPHAGADRTLPVLCAVKFETREEGKLTLVTTDRYSLATYVIDWDGGEVDALLDVDAAKDLLRYVKGIDKPLQNLASLAVTFHEDMVEVFDFSRRATYRLDTDHQYVKWAHIMPSRDDAGEISGINYNPTIMAKFAKAAKRGEPMRLTFVSAVKPTRIEIGDRFVGLIMPVRQAG